MAVHKNRRTTHPQPAAHIPPPATPTAYTPVLPFPSFDYPTGHPGELFHDIVETVQRSTGAPPSICAQAALGIGAFIHQGLIELEAPTGHITSPSLSLVGALPSATNKSTVLEQFQKPVDNFLADYQLRNRALEDDYHKALENWQGARKELRKKLNKANANLAIKKQGSSAATYQKAIEKAEMLSASLDDHEQQEPKPPTPAGLGILGDATPAAFSRFIKEKGIRSLAVITAEAEEFLTQGIKRQSSLLNKGFSGEATHKHRATRGDESHDIPMTFLLLGQPCIMEAAFGGKNNRMRGTGAMSRMLFTCPPPSTTHLDAEPRNAPIEAILARNRIGQDRNAPVKARYNEWVEKQLEKSVRHFHSGASRQRIQLSRDALTLWFQGRDEVKLEFLPGGRYETFHDHGNRLPEQWLRVALVLHGYNCPEDDTISSRTLTTAMGLVNGFSSEFTDIFREVPQIEKDCVTLEEWLNDKRKLYFFIPQSMATRNGPLRPAARLKEALMMLHHCGSITLFDAPTCNQKGQLTKPMGIINLQPHLPPNYANIDHAVSMGRVFNQS